MKIESFVINLKRRPDRLESFKERYQTFGPNQKLNVIEAVDGKQENYLDEVKDLINLVNFENDYETKKTVHATIFSHLKIWKQIVEQQIDYGLIFEDDVYFGREKKTNMIVLVNALLNYPKDSILYFGVGDCLPIHTNAVQSQSLLKSQEKSHVISDEGGYGKPNYNSAYVFDWLGGFSYILSKEMAKELLNFAEKNPINCAVDSWMRKNEFKKYLTVPLLTFTQLEDSDTIY